MYSPRPTKKVTWIGYIRYEHLVAGVLGGVASTVSLHPLDLLKVRLAGKFYDYFKFTKLRSFEYKFKAILTSFLLFLVNDGQVTSRPQYTGLRNAVKTIIRDEGYRGLYRGVGPNCWGAGAAWGFYFLL